MSHNKILCFCFIILVFSSFRPEKQQSRFLHQTYLKLNSIQSASYYETILINSIRIKKYFRITANTNDTLIGAYVAKYNANDTIHIHEFYNGRSISKLNWSNKTIHIDSCNNITKSAIPVHYPMYLQIKAIINYALTTKDDIQTDFKDLEDSIYFRLTIPNKNIAFADKPINIKVPTTDKTFSQFDILFHKKENTPYKLICNWNDTSKYTAIYSDIALNSHPNELLSQTSFPSDFHITTKISKEHALKGIKVPNWALMNTNGTIYNLYELKEDVILLQFTSIYCGPCQLSIPSLNKLYDELKEDSFKLIGIESGVQNLESLRKHQERKKISYTFLKDNPNETQTYQITTLPTFIILDKNHVAREVIIGYTPDKTIEELSTKIKLLLYE